MESSKVCANHVGFTFARRPQEPYDRVIRSTGWRHNTSVYHADARPALQTNGNYSHGP